MTPKWLRRQRRNRTRMADLLMTSLMMEVTDVRLTLDNFVTASVPDGKTLSQIISRHQARRR